ncbi:MAG: hypothetical protein V4692_05540 [Bdellovibrionota bacterium]
MTLKTSQFFSILIPLAALTLGVSGCAPGSASSSGDQVVTPTDDTSELFSFENRTIGVASHTMAMLSETRRMIDESLTMIPNVRIGSLPGQPYSLGCRTYRKVSPHPSSDKPGSPIERFSVSYDRCLDGADRLSRVELTGSEVYQLGYAMPFPKQGEGREIDFPKSISIETTGLTFKGRVSGFSNADSMNVVRRYFFLSSPLFDDGISISYKGRLEATDVYTSIIEGVVRSIETKTNIAETVFVVDRTTRKVLRMSPSEITVTSLGSQYVKGSSVTPREFSNEARFNGNGEMAILTSLCDWPEGSLILNRIEEGSEPVPVTVTGGVVTIGEESSASMRACTIDRLTKSYVPSSAALLQGLYL